MGSPLQVITFISKVCCVLVELGKELLFFTHGIDHGIPPSGQEQRNSNFWRTLSILLFNLVSFGGDFSMIVFE